MTNYQFFSDNSHVMTFSTAHTLIFLSFFNTNLIATVLPSSEFIPQSSWRFHKKSV